MMPYLPTLLATLALAAPDPAPGLVVSVVRFYRAEATLTQVAAFIEAPALAGSSIAVRVTDGAGSTLWDQQWPRPSWDGKPDGSVEHLRFTVGPGTHHLEVVVRDSLGQPALSRTVPVQGFLSPPGASDLLLAPMVRSADVPDAMPRAQEFRRGDLLITAAARAVVSPEAPDLHYVLEAYNGVGGPGTLAVVIEDPAGAVVREAPPAPIQVPVHVAILTGQLDLSSLAPGEYRMRLRLVVDGRLLERTGEFVKQ